VLSLLIVVSGGYSLAQKPALSRFRKLLIHRVCSPQQTAHQNELFLGKLASIFQ
jgi:hypothetical protein